jgi:hypothetical protein
MADRIGGKVAAKGVETANAESFYSRRRVSTAGAEDPLPIVRLPEGVNSRIVSKIGRDARPLRCWWALLGTEGVVVVLVRVAGQDAIEPGANHLLVGVVPEVGVPRVVQRFGEGPGQSNALVELTDGSSPASLHSWPGDGSITSAVPKKSRTWGHAEGTLIG